MAPLELSDANLATTLDCDIDQLKVVLASLIEGGVFHGKPRTVVSTNPRMECDYIRLNDDPLPPVDPWELD